MLVVFDVIARYLRHLGYELTYVRNITDIDDKIIKRAAERGIAFGELTEEFIRYNREDFDALGLIVPDHEPRATESIASIVAMIEALIENGHAYRADNNDVYYSVSSFDGYGRLSGKRLEDLRAGARVEIDEAKRDPLDFVLWKAAKAGEPAWDSPWGSGRPGWHIECSAMSTDLLGEYFDIHGGGMDLKFPHHENEIAQSCGATGQPFVKYWLHNGFVRVDDEKMSKSLGNFFIVRDVLGRYDLEVVRYFILSSHYRSPLNYSNENLDQAKAALDRLYLALRDLPELTEVGDTKDWSARFDAAMSDDFNTPAALAVLKDLAGEINVARSSGKPEQAAALATRLTELSGVIGLLQQDPETYLRKAGTEGGLSDAEIDALIARRNEARAKKDWRGADRYRDELALAGVILEDGSDGTSWRRE